MKTNGGANAFPKHQHAVYHGWPPDSIVWRRTPLHAMQLEGMDACYAARGRDHARIHNAMCCKILYQQMKSSYC